MITVVLDEASSDNVRGEERCCFCRDLTWYWYSEKDVVVCLECARTANPEDVPSKEVWMRRERIAGNRLPTPPFAKRTDFSIRNQLELSVPCVHLGLPLGGTVIISAFEAKELANEIYYYANSVEEIFASVEKEKFVPPEN
jgi:hypothetical protein